MSDGIEVVFNIKFRHLPCFPVDGEKVAISGCGIDIEGIVEKAETDGDVYSCIIKPIIEVIER